jgi:YcxB-like protein
MDQTVTYRFGRADYIALLKARRSLSVFSRFGRWGRYVCYGLFFVGLINLNNVLSWTFDPLIDGAASAVAFVVVVLMAPVGEWAADRILSLWVFPRFVVANKEITIAFADDGLHTKNGGMEGKIPWSAVTRVLETKDHLYLWISRAETIIVPRRALASDDAAAALAAYIKSKVPAAPAA